MVPTLRTARSSKVTIDDILDELVDALIVECPGVLPDGLKRNRRFQRISGICEYHGYVVATYPAGDIFVIEISEAPNGRLVAPVDVLRAALERVRA
jgi:hypothetical protein